MKIGFIGAGKMAQALCRGFIKSGKMKAENIIASCPVHDEHFLDQIRSLGVSGTNDNLEVVRQSDVIFIATKSPMVSKVSSEIATTLTRKQLIISIAMGMTIHSIESLLPSKSRVIRVMPNTPAVVQAAASAFSVGSCCREGDAKLVKDLLSTVGYVVEVPENLMDPITGLSGSGPSYVFAMVEGLADGGVKMGLPRNLAIKLAAHTLIGSAKMILESGKHPAELKDDVQSPAGSSIYGSHKLESGGIRGLLIDAVEAASLRSKETGDKGATFRNTMKISHSFDRTVPHCDEKKRGMLGVTTTWGRSPESKIRFEVMEDSTISWQLPNSSINMVKTDIRDAMLACASSGTTGSVLYSSLHDSKLQTLGQTISPVVGLNYSICLNEVVCVDEHGHIWRFDIRDGESQVFLIRDCFGLESVGKAGAAALSPNGYHLAVGSEFPETMLKKVKKKSKSKNNYGESDDDGDEDLEESPYEIHLFDLRKMNDVVCSYCTYHSDSIQALNFSVDSPSLLMCGGADGLVNFINSSVKDQDDALQFTEQVGSSVDRVGFLTGNRAYATTDDGRYTIFVINSTDDVDVLCRRRYGAEGQFLVDILDSDCPSSFFVFGSSSEGEGELTHVPNNAKKIQFIESFNDHKDLIRCCAYDPVRNRLITGGDDGQIICRQVIHFTPKSSHTERHVVKRCRVTKKQKPY